MMDAAALKALIDTCPFHRLLGIEVDRVDAESGAVTLGLPLRAETSRSPDSLQLHGGVTAALIDIAGDVAVAVVVGHPVVTIDLRVDYLRMGNGARFTATARPVRLGRTIGTVDIEVHDGEGALVAIGRGKFTTS